MIGFRVAAPGIPRALPHHFVAGLALPDAFGQGRGDPRPVPRERGPAPTEPEAAAGLDGPSRACRPDQTPARCVEGAAARHSGHGPVLASSPAHPPLDLPNRAGRPPVDPIAAGLVEQMARDNPGWGYQRASKAICAASDTGSQPPRSAGSFAGAAGQDRFASTPMRVYGAHPADASPPRTPTATASAPGSWCRSSTTTSTSRRPARSPRGRSRCLMAQGRTAAERGRPWPAARGRHGLAGQHAHRRQGDPARGLPGHRCGPPGPA
jgi:hypothetical protein